jgi:nudix-type nucleoside diphosphatase (YffH/AdpP family)
MDSSTVDHGPGSTYPDRRGRVALHLTGRDLAGNPAVEVQDVTVVSDGWHVLRRTTLRYRRRDGSWVEQDRETYDRGNGAVVLPIDRERATVLLTRQYRFPAHVNGHPDGMLIEAAAGLLDGDDPTAAICREAGEELGVTLRNLTPVWQLYMSPGSVTEVLHFFLADYSPQDMHGTGGGVADEGEDIEVLELGLDEALAMTRDGRIQDAKTVLLLQYAAQLSGRVQTG